jgi:hypothetical protein
MCEGCKPIFFSIGSWGNMMFVLPYAEGAARINRAFLGLDLREIDTPELSIFDRCVDLTTGISLFIPIVNSILIIFFRTFGKLELLTKKTTLHTTTWNSALENSNTELPISIYPDTIN